MKITDLSGIESVAIPQSLQKKCLDNNPTSQVNEIAKEVFLLYAKLNKLSVEQTDNTSIFKVNGSAKVRVTGQSSYDDDVEFFIFTPRSGNLNESSTLTYLFPVIYNKNSEIAMSLGFISYDDYVKHSTPYSVGSIIPGFGSGCRYNAFVLSAETISKNKLNKSVKDLTLKIKKVIKPTMSF